MKPWQVNVLLFVSVAILVTQGALDAFGTGRTLNPFVTGTASSVFIFLIAAGDRIKKNGNGKKEETDE